jgi:hypothetical protein
MLQRTKVILASSLTTVLAIAASALSPVSAAATPATRSCSNTVCSFVNTCKFQAGYSCAIASDGKSCTNTWCDKT